MDSILSPEQKIELKLSILEKYAMEYLEANELEQAFKHAISGMKLALKYRDCERTSNFLKLISFIRTELDLIDE